MNGVKIALICRGTVLPSSLMSAPGWPQSHRFTGLIKHRLRLGSGDAGQTSTISPILSPSSLLPSIVIMAPSDLTPFVSITTATTHKKVDGIFTFARLPSILICCPDTCAFAAHNIFLTVDKFFQVIRCLLLINRQNSYIKALLLSLSEPMKSNEDEVERWWLTATGRWNWLYLHPAATSLIYFAERWRISPFLKAGGQLERVTSRRPAVKTQPGSVFESCFFSLWSH